MLGCGGGGGSTWPLCDAFSLLVVRVHTFVDKSYCVKLAELKFSANF